MIEARVLEICGAFLLGTLTGAAGTYFGTKYTDQRRNKESKDAARKKFHGVKSQMPELIAALGKRIDAHPLTREVLVRGPEQIAFRTGDQSRREGHASGIAELPRKIALLENNGYICKSGVRGQSSAEYTMTEDFVELLKERK